MVEWITSEVLRRLGDEGWGGWPCATDPMALRQHCQAAFRNLQRLSALNFIWRSSGFPHSDVVYELLAEAFGVQGVGFCFECYSVSSSLGVSFAC